MNGWLSELMNEWVIKLKKIYNINRHLNLIKLKKIKRKD